MTIKFVCPKCRNDELECCMEGSHTCPVTEIDESGDFEYGEYESTADVDRWQCADCGFILKDKYEEVLIEDQEVAEWCKINCQQE